MDAHEFQEGIGATGKFGETFVVLGILFAIWGGIMWGMGATGTWPESNINDFGDESIIPIGVLYFIMGVGFAAFGVLIILSGWARHHPGYDESH